MGKGKMPRVVLCTSASSVTGELYTKNQSCVTAVLVVKNHKMEEILKLQSTITCPNCGAQKEETMPTDSCQYFYQCEVCNTILKPLPGDCCVYCSYGSAKCPPIQMNKSCCG